DDATSLDNLLKALDMIDECNKLRADHGLEPLKVSETAMAMAMVQANYAANGHYNHNYQYDNVGENLDWGFSDDDPYDDWYTAEKETYDAAVKSGDYPDLAKLSPYDVFLKYPDLYQQVGHYLNIVDPEYIAAGMAYSGYGETNYDHAFTQEYFNDWNSYNANDTTFDASVYRAKVEAYVNQIKSAQS
ncbi:CAP domain-containing protein, partial [Bifidobacterium adolescentis]|uniref:CAP domain-containing protein n=1 Tax=Bifidobacterium adolescentis TaxID=1680 RepID=UPI00398D0E5D